MRRLLFFLVVILLGSVTKSFSQTNVSSNLTANTTWTKANSPYILTGNVGVPAAYTLTIEPGVTVQRNADYQILVNGALVCKGSTADSIVFASGTSIVYSLNTFFVEFQKSNLNSSSLRFVSFRNQSGNANNVRVGNEGESSQTSPKNSGILAISRSNLSYGYIVTKGYNAAQSLNIDSSYITSANIIGNYPRSEAINISNTTVTNSTINSQAYNFGIGFTNCSIYNCQLEMACCGANLAFSNSKIEASRIAEGFGEGADGIVRFTNSLVLNTPVYMPNAQCIFSGSKVIVTKPVSNLINTTNYIVITGNISSTNSEISNYSSNPYSGVYIRGNSISGVTSNVINTNISNTYDALYFSDINAATISANNFINTTRYCIANYTIKNISAPGNYFGLKTGKTIDDVIYDSNDDLRYGTVIYTASAPAILTSAQVSKPANVFKSSGSGNVIVTWSKNKEANIKNYKVYWGYASTFSYRNSALVTSADSTFSISGASITDSIAVTALNTNATGTNDQLNGYESWFAPANIKAPAITSFTPVAAGAGTTVTITGTDLYSLTSVSFGGRAAASYTIISPTTVTADVGSGASGSVSVTNSKGTSSLAGFTFIPAPFITSFTPALAGAGNTVTINGANLTGTTAITFSGVPAASFTVVSATVLKAVVGAGATGSIAVTTPGGTASIAGFTYLPPPAITSFTPQSQASGNTVVITGASFSSVSNVSIGGVAAASFTVNSSTSITATVGAGAVSGSISVTTPAGTAMATGFIYLPAPVVTSFLPASATLGSTVTITGLNFTGVTAVKFGSTAAAAYTVTSPNTITAVVGAGTTGTVTVTTTGGTISLAGFTYIPPVPAITAFNPASATAGTVMTITGTNFIGATAVSFGGIAAGSFNVASATSIIAIVPLGALSGSISVAGPGGTATIPGFTFLPVPTITSFTPAVGKAGSTITITGTNFTNATSVSFGGTAAASFAIVSPTSIIAVAGAGSTGAVAVGNANGTASLVRP